MPEQQDFFGTPEFLCSIFEESGIHTGPWKAKVEHGPYFCEYDGQVLSSHPGPETSPVAVPHLIIVYRISGDRSKRADIITIAVTVHQPQKVSPRMVNIFQGIEMISFRDFMAVLRK